MNRFVFLLVVFTMTLAACTPSTATEAPMMEGGFDIKIGTTVLTAAKGQTINWYIWGGSDSINAFVDDFYGKSLKEKYDITLNRVPLADTVDAVNQVLSEKQAGKDPGAVDMIWINGENFFTLKQADMLYKDWAQKLPNSKYVNWENPAINLDFGNPVDDMESPWSSAQFQFVYDSARMSADELPRSYAELKDMVMRAPWSFYVRCAGTGRLYRYAFRQRRAV